LQGIWQSSYKCTTNDAKKKKSKQSYQKALCSLTKWLKENVRNKKKISQIAWKTPHESKCPHLSIFSSTVIPVHI
jgi:hypothetical protein